MGMHLVVSTSFSLFFISVFSLSPFPSLSLSLSLSLSPSLALSFTPSQLAGYSLQELFMLSRSLVSQQRTLALSTLANIITKVQTT